MTCQEWEEWDGPKKWFADVRCEMMFCQKELFTMARLSGDPERP